VVDSMWYKTMVQDDSTPLDTMVQDDSRPLDTEQHSKGLRGVYHEDMSRGLDMIHAADKALFTA